MNEEELTIWTVGHSTRTLDEFVELLTVDGIETLVDVRRFPASRRTPHFNQDPLRTQLQAVGVEYLHTPELGGRRRPRPDSRNTRWRDDSFRGYADYMETEGFRSGIERLFEAARRKRTCVMCAEAVWWRCHRSLIADYLKSAGVCVRHIMSRTKTELHPFTAAARLRDGRLSYSPDE
jgi:uncharacterized protein (DUF488 family)